jgi:protein-S-isoprenylcysteine O-methyltransferase Ste14
MKRLALFVYGVLCYAVALATLLYAAGFIGGFLTPTTLDGGPTAPLWEALLIDLALLVLFAVQHSVMARPAFKRWWTQVIPEPAERATYVLAASVALIALFALWQPLGGRVWHVEDLGIRLVLYALFAFGWALVVSSTFLIDHFDLFGLRQVWLHLHGRPYTSPRFVTPGPYRLVRHPLYVGWLFVFWAAPTMSAAHLLFALATTAYILIAIQLEEHDLVAALGSDYAQYRRSVPMLVPRLPGTQRAHPARHA